MSSDDQSEAAREPGRLKFVSFSLLLIPLVFVLFDAFFPREEMLLELARAYRLAGKTNEARTTLTQIVEQHADSPFVSEAKTELEKIKG